MKKIEGSEKFFQKCCNLVYDTFGIYGIDDLAAGVKIDNGINTLIHHRHCFNYAKTCGLFWQKPEQIRLLMEDLGIKHGNLNNIEVMHFYYETMGNAIYNIIKKWNPEVVK